ncbi:hypothetical protein B0H63DRAFT_559171 [Podospora didyma]|uniref:Transmembrane and coiled-coil domain-containing protein 4 n=1 Tax=Podospora didyma TaxID=330526 RepID=A0AAE0U1S0_9PEZI|nr:hypothetical protein B0H63DRAFT_559171 [Podospora didyma]
MEGKKDASSKLVSKVNTSASASASQSQRSPTKTDWEDPLSPESLCSESGDNDADMARLRFQPRREVDLTTLLTVSELAELVSLVNKVIDTMQQHIEHVYDPRGVVDCRHPSLWSEFPMHLKDHGLAAPSREPAGSTETRNEPQTKPAASNKENVNPSSRDRSTSPPADHLGISKLSLDDIYDVTKNESVEVEGPRLSELLKDNELVFKRWQTSVLRRLCDISTKAAVDNQSSRFASAGSRRGSSKNKPTGSRTMSVEPDPQLTQLYPPFSTKLVYFPLEKRMLLLHALVLLLVSLEHYNAFSRILLLYITSTLRLPRRLLADEEVRLAKALAQVAKDIPVEDFLPKKAEEGKSSKKWKPGTSAGSSSTSLVTAAEPPKHTLAAPLIAVGIGGILGGAGLGSTVAANLLAGLAESNPVLGSLFALGRAPQKSLVNLAKDCQNFAFIPIRGSRCDEEIEISSIDPEFRRLRVIIGVSGWLVNEGRSDESDIISPWQIFGRRSEVYGVQWETEPLIKMGAALEVVVQSAAWSMAKKEIIARTSKPSSTSPNSKKPTNSSGPVIASLHQGVWPESLVKIAKIIDNPWCTGMVRADKAGVTLADYIWGKSHGDRGVTLIGYSLGARLIYCCLMALADRRAFGLVENVVLLGAPIPSDAITWCTMKSVVAGRLINVYSENDYLLGFLFRTSSFEYGVAGLQPIEGVDGVENVDITTELSSHWRYRYLTGSVLKHVGWEDIDPVQVARDEEALALAEHKNMERDRMREAIEIGKEATELEPIPAPVFPESITQEAIQTRKRKQKGRK